MSPSSQGEPTSITSRRPGGAMPETIAPMFAARAPEPFDSKEHIFELMWGGMRAMAHVRDGGLRLRATNGLDLTAHFPELAAVPDLVDAREAIIDGEIIVMDADGHPVFDALRPRLHAIASATLPAELSKPRRVAGQLCFQAFDLLWLDGKMMVDRPLWQRKNRLHNILRPSPEFVAIDFVDDEGIAFFEAVLQRKLEGVVAKEKASAYTPGKRSPAWREVRALQSGDFVVGGYTFGGAARRGEAFNRVLLGAYDDGRFEYIGAVTGGMDDAEARQLVALLEPLVVPRPPFVDPPPLSKLVYWTEPVVVCRVRFSEWSRDGHLRFPIFSALRPDISADDCTLD
jgi:DNA ligase D-like protein (predicted ligase)